MHWTECFPIKSVPLGSSQNPDFEVFGMGNDHGLQTVIHLYVMVSKFGSFYRKPIIRDRIDGFIEG